MMRGKFLLNQHDRVHELEKTSALQAARLRNLTRMHLNDSLNIRDMDLTNNNQTEVIDLLTTQKDELKKTNSDLNDKLTDSNKKLKFQKPLKWVFGAAGVLFGGYLGYKVGRAVP